jgi:rod shape-determining protein MreD
MRFQTILKAVVVFSALVALHYTVRPLLGWRVSADFLVMAVLLMAVRLRPGAAAVLGFATGLVADSLAPTAFGAGALAMTLIGFAASRAKAVFFADNVLLHASFFFVGKLVHDIIFLLAERRVGLVEFVAQLFIWVPLSAALTAIVGVFLVVVFRPMLEPQAA